MGGLGPLHDLGGPVMKESDGVERVDPVPDWVHFPGHQIFLNSSVLWVVAINHHYPLLRYQDYQFWHRLAECFCFQMQGFWVVCQNFLWHEICV